MFAFTRTAHPPASEFLMPMDEAYPMVAFREGEMVRLKLPLVGLPVPEMVAIKVEKALKKTSGVTALAKGLAETDVWLKYGDSAAVFQIPTCTARHAGEWTVVAKNEYGQAQADIRFANSCSFYQRRSQQVNGSQISSSSS